ncbi:hypothetical protein V5O48_019035, partial [Marasmius crinis-equi]
VKGGDRSVTSILRNAGEGDESSQPIEEGIIFVNSDGLAILEQYGAARWSIAEGAMGA